MKRNTRASRAEKAINRLQQITLWISMAMLLGAVNASAGTMFFSYAELYPSNTPAFTPNTNTSSSLTGTINGATNKAFGSLANGQLGVLNAGTNISTGGGLYETIAELGDTVSASGNFSSGLAGLNLGMSFSINGLTSFTNPGDNFSYLQVYVLAPGSFDQTIFTAPQNILFAEGFLLGQGTNPDAGAVFASDNVPLTGTFGDGTNSLPLTIPLSTVGTSFEIYVVLGSVQVTPAAGSSWSADFSHTVDLSLSASPGVTLTSASGVLPGATTPEPGTLALIGSGLTAVLLQRARRRS
jgi:hypothetical protein